MSLATADLPADPEALRAFALACQSRIGEASAELQAAKLAVQLLRWRSRSSSSRSPSCGGCSSAARRSGSPARSSSSSCGSRSWRPARPRTSAKAEAEEPPLPHRASAPGRSASRCRIICRARRSCTSRRMTAPAPAPTAAAAWPGSARTSPKCWITCPATSR